MAVEMCKAQRWIGAAREKPGMVIAGIALLCWGSGVLLRLLSFKVRQNVLADWKSTNAVTVVPLAVQVFFRTLRLTTRIPDVCKQHFA
jgi:hypothetical protein